MSSAAAPSADLFDTERTFRSFGFDPRVLTALGRMGFQRPTVVQAQAIEVALLGKDVLVRARTGSGKTAAYALPALHKILVGKKTDSARAIRAVVLVPTRELAEQVKEVFRQLCRYCAAAVRVYSAAGEETVAAQRPRFAELPDIVVSTPGRLLAHIQEKNVDLSGLQTLVIDEADLVLSFGYADDIAQIAKALPAGVQSLLMSATLSEEVESLKKLVLHNPAVLKLQEDEGFESRLTQYRVPCEEDDKFLFTYALLRLRIVHGKALIFVNSIFGCYRLKLLLDSFGVNCGVLNSELPVLSRYHIISAFNRDMFDYLIATDESMLTSTDDVFAGEAEEKQAKSTLGKRGASKANSNASDDAADDDEGGRDAAGDDDDDDSEGSDADEGAKQKAAARAKEARRRASHRRGDEPVDRKDDEYGVSRGIDFSNVSTVINFDMPESARGYIHRIGRTARAGAHGNSITFVTSDDAEKLGKIERYLKSHNRPEIQEYPVTIEKVDAFRYRVTDVLRQINKKKVKEARLAEIRSEILASDKLKAHFEDNPEDLQALKHNRSLQRSRNMAHLRTIPAYLRVAGLSSAPHNSIERKIKVSAASSSAFLAKRQRRAQDPLRSFRYRTGAPPASKPSDAAGAAAKAKGGERAKRVHRAAPETS